MNQGFMKAKIIVSPKHTYRDTLTYTHYIHFKLQSLFPLMVFFLQSHYSGMKVHLIVNRRHLEKRRTLTGTDMKESIIEPTAQGKDLFSISKYSQTLNATENNGVIQQDFNESPLYILMMCKCESNNTESHNIGYTVTYTNDSELGPQRSHSATLNCSFHFDFSPHVQPKRQQRSCGT